MKKFKIFKHKDDTVTNRTYLDYGSYITLIGRIATKLMCCEKIR